jgi:hypothetical protein
MTQERFLRLTSRKVTISPADLEEVFTGEIRNLLTESNPKILKGSKKGYLTAIMHLSPSDRSGFNTCPMATFGCREACLNTAGHGGIRLKSGEDNGVQKARKRRTWWFFARRDEFMQELALEIAKHVRKAERKGMTPAIRLNGTSDIRWETIPVGPFANIFQMFPDVIFYDYTKIPGRDLGIGNYHLTFSVADGNDETAATQLERGMNLAVVFDEVPAEYLGTKVVDGDESDLRFLDPKGVIVGLYAKGDAKKDTTGFVKRVAA